MSSKRSKIARTAAAALLSCALVVGPLGLGGAQAELGAYNAQSTGFALRVVFDFTGLPQDVQTQITDAYDTAVAALPAEAQAALPENPLFIDQTFALTTAEASETVTKATSDLADGLVDLPTVTAENQGEDHSSSNETVQVPPIVEGLDVSALEAVTGLVRATVAQGPVVDGEATFAQVNATLANVASLLPPELQQAFQDAIDEVNATIDTAAATGEELNTSLQDAADDTEASLVGTPLEGVLTDAGIIGGAATLGDTVTAAFAGIDVPNPLDAGVNLAEVTDIVSTTTAQRTTDSKSSADAVSEIKSVNVLDGLLSVGLINIASHSEANGTAGSANNSASCSLADVRLGDTNAVSIDGETIYLEVDGEQVEIPVADDNVADLRDQVTGVLNQAGIDVQLCDSTTANADPNGLSADQTVSAFVVTIEPTAPADVPALGLSAGDPLVRVMIDPTVQTAVAASQAVAPQVDEPTTNPPLPRTGPAAFATLLAGFALAGGGLAVRRRMMR